MGKFFFNLNAEKCFQTKTRNSDVVRDRTNKFDYLKRENFYMAENISKSKDKQYTRWKYYNIYHR